MSNRSGDGMEEAHGYGESEGMDPAGTRFFDGSAHESSTHESGTHESGAGEPADDPGMNAPMTPPGPTWFQRLSTVLFIIFCFELGLFLLVYPWTESWSSNYFAWAFPGAMQTTWHTFWQNTYTRGGVSGIGIVNIWIAIMELFRMFRDRHRGHQ